MKTEHTPEPWRIGNGRSALSKSNVYDKFGQRIANSFEGVMATQRSDSECEANARRIVACVNACAGIETFMLEMLLENKRTIMQDLDDLTKQRDELLAALEKFLDDNNPEGFGCACEPDRLCGPCSEAKRQRPLYAAIASVKEK